MRRITAPLVLGFALAAAALVAMVPSPSHAQQWGEIANISSTMGVTDGRICTGEGSRGDIGCMPNAPYVSRVTGALGIGTAAPSATLHVSGTLRISNGAESCDADRLGAMKYQAGAFYICKSTFLGWEPVQTSTSSTTPSINTGLSGSIVFRDEYGYLKANNTFSISSTTGSIGIGAGAPVSLGNNGLYVSGNIQSGNAVYVTNGPVLTTSGSLALIHGATTTSGLSLAGSANMPEAIRIVSSGFVGIDTQTPSTALHVSGTLTIANGNESCTPDHLGAVKYEDGNFYICRNGSIWETLVAGGSGALDTDRITSETTAVIASDAGYVTISGSTYIGANTMQDAVLEVGYNPLANRAAYLDLTGDTTYADYGLRIIRNNTGENASSQLIHRGTGNFSFQTTEAAPLVFLTSSSEAMRIVSTGYVGIGITNPSSSLHIDGGIRIAADTDNCDANRLGAIRFQSNQFFICRNGTDWETMLAGTLDTDRITSSTTAAVITNEAGGTVSFTLGGTDGAAYMHPELGFVGPGVSTTGTVSASDINAGFMVLRGTSGTAGVSITMPGDDLGSHIAGSDLNMNGYKVINASAIGIGVSLTTPSATLHVSGTIRMSNGGENCDANRLGAMKYQSGLFYLCKNTSLGWEPVQTSTSSTIPSINTGLSGSLVFRDEYGYLKANNTYNISSTTGSVGIGAGAPATLGNNGLYASGNIQSGNAVYVTGGPVLASSGTLAVIYGGNPVYGLSLAGAINRPEAIRITSNGLVGISGMSPTTALDISGTLRVSNGTESCDASRLGAIKYQANQFYLCRNGTTWENMVAGTSGFATTSFISLTDVSVSLPAFNIFGPGSLSGATNGITGSTAYGVQALRSATATSYNNSGFGYNALSDNTNGYYNTAVGAHALSYNIGGYYNTAVGGAAMFANTSGYGNTAMGGNTLRTNTVGYNNSAFGQGALYDNLNGTNNAAFGNNALSDSLGSNNAALGASSLLYANVTNTVAIGYSAGAGSNGATTFQNGTLLGAYAGQALTSGGSNTLVGYNAGGGITSGASNLVLGVGTTPFSNTGSWQLNIGNAVWGNIGSGMANTNLIGINASSPTTALHVSGTLRIADGRESCDTNRLGAIKYDANQFYVCKNTSNGWEAMATTGPNTLADRIVSGTAYVQSNVAGNVTISGTTYIGYNTATSNSLEIGFGGTGNRSALIDLTGDATYTDYGLRFIRHNGGANAPSDIIHRGTGAFDIQTTESAPIVFITAGTESMRILPSGNVGIGTAIPSTTLHLVSSTIYQLRMGTGTAAVSHGYLGTDANGFTRMGGQVGAALMYGPPATPQEALRVTSLGLIGISTTQPSTSLHVSGTIRISDGNENCDIHRLGAIKYEAGQFYVCRNTSNGWEAMATAGSSSSIDRIVSGTSYVQANGPGGNVTISGTTYIGYQTATSSTLEIGFGSTANSNAVIDLTGDTTYTDYGLRIIRTNTGANAPSNIFHRGTGAFTIQTMEAGAINLTTTGAAPIVFNTTNAEAMRILANGNVGISTAIPSTTLHIGGTLRLAADPAQTCDTFRLGAIKYETNQFYVCRNTSNGWETMATIGPNTLADRIVSGTAYVQSNVAGNVTISGTTYIGYQTATSSTLEIGFGSTANSNAVIDLTGDSTYTDFGLRIIRTNTGANAPTNIIHRGTGAFTLRTQEAAPIVFDTSNGESMRIMPTGFVGISTSIPSATLHVAGAIRMAADGAQTCDTHRLGAIKYETNQFYVCRNISNGWEAMATAGGTSSIDRIVSGTAYVQSNVAGNVTISGTTYIGYQTATSNSLEIGFGGTGNRSALIDLTGDATYTDFGLRIIRNGTGANTNSDIIHRGTGAFTLRTSDSAPIAFYTDGSESMRILANGNIGISTSTPNAKLEVNGRTSTTTLQLSNSPADACNAAAYGTMKMVNGRPYVCRP